MALTKIEQLLVEDRRRRAIAIVAQAQREAEQILGEAAYAIAADHQVPGHETGQLSSVFVIDGGRVVAIEFSEPAAAEAPQTKPKLPPKPGPVKIATSSLEALRAAGEAT